MTITNLIVTRKLLLNKQYIYIYIEVAFNHYVLIPLNPSLCVDVLDLLNFEGRYAFAQRHNANVLLIQDLKKSSHRFE